MKQFNPKSARLILIMPIALLLSLPTFSQTLIQGRILDAATQLPLQGVTVTVSGEKRGTPTNARGEYSINAKPGSKLVITSVGYEPIEISAEEANTITQLTPSSTQLTGVVVTALGVKKELKKLGYSVQEVKGEDLVKARDQNPITGLTGKVAGLSVGPSPELLRSPTVLLRGNAINLYVVDGVPISSDTWNISPDDVESYTILKGPAAAALYGSRAQYGAILITTKKGSRKGKGWSVELNSTNSVDNGFLAFPRVQDQYGAGENQLYAFGDGKGGGLNDNDNDVWGPKFRGQLIPQYDGEYDPNTTFSTTFPGGYVWEGHVKPTPYIARGKNNLQRFLRPGFQTTNNISLSTGGDNYSLRFSLSHSYQESIIPNMQLNISNFNLFGSYNPSSRLKIDANLNFNRQYTPNFPDVDYGPKFPLMEDAGDNLQYVFTHPTNDYPENPGNFGFNALRENTSATYLGLLTSLHDPRTFVTAEPATALVAAGKSPTDFSAFVGADPGEDLGSMYAKANAGQYSLINRYRYYSTYTGEPSVQIGFPEQCFNIAEAIDRGWITGGPLGGAEEYYKAGIKASLESYGIPESGSMTVYFLKPGASLGTFDTYSVNVDFAKYYGQDGVKYSGGTSGLKQILQQKYLAMFRHSGLEAYYQWRRTGIPNFTTGTGTGNSGRIALRFQYPGNEITVNTNNYQPALKNQFGGNDDINGIMWILQ